MNQLQQWSARSRELYQKVQPGLQKTGEILRLIGLWIWRLRKFILAVPVVYLSLTLARLNYNLLPDMVGIDLQTTGAYARLITRQAAIYGPLAVTAGCMLMMFLSRKTLYPWLISLFSLALPLVILLTNLLF